VAKVGTKTLGIKGGIVRSGSGSGLSSWGSALSSIGVPKGSIGSIGLKKSVPVARSVAVRDSSPVYVPAPSSSYSATEGVLVEKLAPPMEGFDLGSFISGPPGISGTNAPSQPPVSQYDSGDYLSDGMTDEQLAMLLSLETHAAIQNNTDSDKPITVAKNTVKGVWAGAAQVNKVKAPLGSKSSGSSGAGGCSGGNSKKKRNAELRSLAMIGK